MGRPFTESNDDIAFKAGFDAAVLAIHNGLNVSFPTQVVEARARALIMRQEKMQKRKLMAKDSIKVMPRP